MPKKADTRQRRLPKVALYFAKRELLRQENTPDARKRAKDMLTHWSGKHTAKDVSGYYTKRGKHPIRGSYGHASNGQAHARKSLILAKPTAVGGKRKVYVKHTADFTRYK